MADSISFVRLDIHKESIVGGLGWVARRVPGAWADRHSDRSGLLASQARRGGVTLRFAMRRGRAAMAFNVTCRRMGTWARVRCGCSLLDPEASGGPGQDGPAGCCRSGNA